MQGNPVQGIVLSLLIVVLVIAAFAVLAYSRHSADVRLAEQSQSSERNLNGPVAPAVPPGFYLPPSERPQPIVLDRCSPASGELVPPPLPDDAGHKPQGSKAPAPEEHPTG
jgi:hypothetical protein